MKTKKLFNLVLLVLFIVIISCESGTEKPRPTFTLSTVVSPTEGGTITVSPASGPYNEGQTVTLTPLPSTNWIFQKWEGDASGNSSPLSFTMNANKSVTGVFIKRDYPLNIVIEGEGTFTETIVANPGGREFPHGTTVELTPFPDEGWVFESWGGDLSGGEVPQRITVDGEKNVTVIFKPESNSLFYLAENGITCKCEEAKSGDQGMINGVEYEAVDNELLRQRRGEGVDMTKLCTSLVTDMSELFYERDFNQAIGNWDVGNVTDMNRMFANSQFNQPIERWDVSNVTNMGAMFFSSPFNQAIGDWDVRKVTYMYEMFRSSQFNQPIGDWDVSNVAHMGGMFRSSPFNQLIADWDVSEVTDMNSMFSESTFKQAIGNWDVTNVKDMDFMFFRSEFNQPIEDWDVSSVTSMRYMFSESIFNLPIGDWDVSNVTKMSSMFAGTSFNQPIGGWNVSKVTTMSEMFYYSKFNQPIGNWDVGNVTSMILMFVGNANFNQDLSKWCVIKIPSRPQNFRTGATAWVLPEPVWGTCPD